ncbi:MAG: LLM class flavin-dependent oxidoreductase [Candidatus Rokubacteria bacterium]|nr:LLM class flavin-dependent oxidoreductase [Candidatus Rokubacteria bacterium]
MKFGIFMGETRRGLGQAAAFHEAFGLVDAAEAWGLDGVWLGEIHFTPARSVLSAPLVVAGAIAARTRRLRVGTAVHLLPLNNPLHIAEEVATVDQVSEGRFAFGIGRSGSPRAYEGYGIPYAESQARFREALEIIREAWKGEPFSYQGEFYRFETTVVSPRPYQQPHPPIRMAANSEETFLLVARLGLSLFVGLRSMDIPELRSHLRAYRKAWQETGHAGEASVHLRIPLYAGTTEKAALEEPRESITYYFRRQAEFARSAAGPADRREALAEQLANLSYEQILQTRVAFGSAAGLIDRLTRLREELGVDGIVAEMNPGGLIPAERERQSLRILTHQVMPAFK